MPRPVIPAQAGIGCRRLKRFLISWIPACAGMTAMAAGAQAVPSHCLTLYGECKYQPGFTHFDYVNPDAPKGGLARLAEQGTFDNLNPFILKGVKAPGTDYLFETLMAASFDEPQSLYGLVADSVDVAQDRLSAEFSLRKQARWHDGTPITPDDVAYTFATLTRKGDPTYKILFAGVASCEKTGPQTVRFTFKEPGRELPLLVAQMPLISKTYFAGHDFEKATLDAPLSSGPYKVASVDPGRSVTYGRVEDYWAKDLPVNRGMYNFARLRYDLYKDENVSMEALKAGEYDFRREYIARNWATAYDAPAVRDGRIVKREIPDATPQGMQAFIFNTRLPKFADRRVREAIALSLDFQWLNKTIFYGAYTQNGSFFQNTDFAATGLPGEAERRLLEPYAADLPPGLLERPFALPVTDGSGNARENLLKAQKLLQDAGWTIRDGKLVSAAGEKLAIEFLLRQPTMERVIGPMRKNLERLGISATIRLVDDSQYQKRTDSHDFDIVSIWVNRGLFYPGNEQSALWASSQAEVSGGNNLGGVASKPVDALLTALNSAKDLPTLTAAGRALDRVLLWEHYVIPNWHSGSFRVAYWDKFGMPDVTPKYNLGFQTWWSKEAAK